MNVEAFLAAPAVIQVHMLSALAALITGAIQLLAPKGVLPHRILGTVWVGLMALTAVTAIFIREINAGGLSPVHLFIPLALFGLVGLARSVQLRQRRRHRGIVLGLYFGALIVPGLFTLIPGRLMHAIVFGYNAG